MITEYITIGKVIEHKGLFWNCDADWTPNLDEAHIYPTDSDIDSVLSDICNFSCISDFMDIEKVTVVPIKRVVYIELCRDEFDMTTNEGRLAYAKKHYPIGTFIKSIHSDIVFKSTEEPRNYMKTTIVAESDNGCVDIYHDGEWAEIIKEEFDMTTNEGRLAYATKNYPIGTKYIPLDGVGDKYVKNSIYTSNCTPKLWENRLGDKGIEVSSIGLVYHEGTNRWAEIIKEEIKETNMSKQKLSRQGLKEIHSVACSNWKGKLEGMGIRNPLEDYIELTQEEVDAMFKACTKEQLSIVSKYLKQDDGSVDITKFNGKIFGEDGRAVIEKRFFGEYANKSLFLGGGYNWEIKTDELGQLCLIPTKKK